MGGELVRVGSSTPTKPPLTMLSNLAVASVFLVDDPIIACIQGVVHHYLRIVLSQNCKLVEIAKVVLIRCRPAISTAGRLVCFGEPDCFTGGTPIA